MQSETQQVVDELKTLNKTIESGFGLVALILLLVSLVTMCSS